MSQLTEADIINAAYAILEQDSAGWDTSSAEYLTARTLINIGIGRWEMYDNMRWRDLWARLTDALDGDKAIVATTFSYKCPLDMRFPSSWVRTVDPAGNHSYWKVIDPQNLADYAGKDDRICFFTGSMAAGFSVNLNPHAALNSGDTLEYEYYKQATKLTTTTDKPELQDPYFLAYFIASHMAEGGLDPDLYNMAEARLDQMKTENLTDISNSSIAFNIDFDSGFGV